MASNLDEARKAIREHGLQLPFAAPDEPFDVVSVAFRNEYGTQSAAILWREGFGAMCEHGSTVRHLDINGAFRSMRRPSFCDKCIRFACDNGREPVA